MPRILNGLSFSVQQVIGEIFSFTGTAAGGKQLTCYRSYEKFTERCHVSRATVARALKIGRNKGLIKGNHKNGYESLISASNGEFLRLPNWVMLDRFLVRENIERKLTKSEQYIYAFLFTRCTNKKNGKHTIKISISKLASELNISERTVQSALWTLIRAGLIYRPKEDKGINAYKVSKYTLNYKLVLVKKKNERKIRKEAEKALREQNSSDPFPEFNQEYTKGKDEFLYDNNETKVEFFLHTPPKSTPESSTTSHKQKPLLEIDSLKKYVDPNDRLNLNLKLAPTAELEEVITLYKPIFGQLSIVSQAWYDFVRYELKRRNGEDIP
ncbi:MAG: hypothetical protein ACI4MN_04030 [Candidatus Coproplasma sp.]